MNLPYGDTRHGLNGYTNLGCRCALCRRAAADYNRRRGDERRALLVADPSLAQHGRASTYGNWKCRCQPCTAAWAADALARYHRRKARAAA